MSTRRRWSGALSCPAPGSAPSLAPTTSRREYWGSSSRTSAPGKTSPGWWPQPACSCPWGRSSWPSLTLLRACTNMARMWRNLAEVTYWITVKPDYENAICKGISIVGNYYHNLTHEIEFYLRNLGYQKSIFFPDPSYVGIEYYTMITLYDCYDFV